MGIERGMDSTTIFQQAVALHRADKLETAVQLYRKTLALAPDHADAALLCAMALQQLDRSSEALTTYQLAVKLAPKDPDALSGLGTMQLAHGRYGDAVSTFESARRLAPPSSELLCNLGVAYKNSGNPVMAVSTLEESMALEQNSPDAAYNLGNAWQLRGDMASARACYERASRLSPSSVAPRWGACFAHLDALYDDEAGIRNARNAYQKALNRLDEHLTLDSSGQTIEAAEAVGANQPFYLTYQGHNDRELQTTYGRMVSRIMRAAYPHLASSKPGPTSNGRIRVGIVSGFMHEHSVWKIPIRGWAAHLDRDRFEVIGCHTGFKTDHCTEEALRLFDLFFHEPHDFSKLCQTLIDLRLDAIIHPDIGMDPVCAKLGGLRLAPVQCVSLGHPMTTGLPDMDYFLSSDLMEPVDGQDAYTEKLVRLPNLGIHYTPLRGGPPLHDRKHFGLAEDDLLYLCPQSLYKYLPQYDVLFPSIAKRLKNCRFVFLKNAMADVLNARFTARIARAFSDCGLVMEDHVVFLPYLAPDEYHSLNCVCDVFLDSIEWSGFNTAMEAANAGLPAVSHPTGHMRGRHAAAVIQRLDCAEACADSFEDYVELAVRIGADDDFRRHLAMKTKNNRRRLFNDMTAVEGLASFLIEAVAASNR